MSQLWCSCFPVILSRAVVNGFIHKKCAFCCKTFRPDDMIAHTKCTLTCTKDIDKGHTCQVFLHKDCLEEYSKQVFDPLDRYIHIGHDGEERVKAFGKYATNRLTCCACHKKTLLQMKECEKCKRVVSCVNCPLTHDCIPSSQLCNCGDELCSLSGQCAACTVPLKNKDIETVIAVRCKHKDSLTHFIILDFCSETCKTKRVQEINKG